MYAIRAISFPRLWPRISNRMAGGLIALLLITSGSAAALSFASGDRGTENPIVAGMRAMLEAMGFEPANKTPFPDRDPFASMGSMPWGGMGSMPWGGMGSMPWGGMGSMPWGGMGSMPWGGMSSMPGLSPWSAISGMPGASSPGDFARPGRWTQHMPPAMRRDRGRYPGPPASSSPTRELDGIWVGENGDRLWFRDGWVRVYRDQHSDARALLHDGRLYIGIPETKSVLQFDYGVRGDYLGLRDDQGGVQILHRYR